ncbi:hypothetical protein DL95DRAFT_393928 [Leptodontidium sp. 2 PMI_412]|nr:hypothetical protein DL95DRAFT_393928 [Leptodontidium sp. 2 PMI_412]
MSPQTSSRNLFKETEYTRTPVLRQPRTSIAMFRNFIHQQFLKGPISHCHGAISKRFKTRTAPQFGMVDSSMTEGLSWLRMGRSGILTSSPQRWSVVLNSTKTGWKK